MLSPKCVRTEFDDEQSADSLRLDGWREVETLVRWTRPISCVFNGDYDYSQDYENCRPAEKSDLGACLALAENQFLFDRMHIDNEVKLEDAEQFKAAWIERAFQNVGTDVPSKQQTRSVFVHDDGGISGFIISRNRGGRLTVDLICVDAKCRNTGIGRRLVEVALWKTPFRGLPQFTCIEAGASARNADACDFWRCIGFTPDTDWRTFHK